MRRLALGVVVSVALAGCGEEASTDAPATVTGAIDFTWKGTIAGRDDRLHLEPDGSATLTSSGGRPEALDIPAPVLDNLRAHLEAADIAALDGDYEGPPVSDGSVQSITVAGHRVVSSDGAGPPALGTVLSDFVDIVANAGTLVRFRQGIRTTIGPDIAAIEVTDDGIASMHSPNSGNTTEQLSPDEVATIKAALEATPFEARGTPGFVDSRAPLDEDQVVLAYRWLTLEDPPATARPALKILRGLLPLVP
jgi:hypothetical protein